MNSLSGLFDFMQVPSAHLAERFILALLIAFIVGQLNAWCYK